MFRGAVVNVSGWRDEDKEGARYREYFAGCESYAITNYKAEARGMQGAEGEIFLDLEAPLADGLKGKFDVVFNHTVLEHVYDFRTAFANLCRMSRDAVIVVVPWLQPYHGDYGDYWRFSPSAVRRMYEDEGLTPLYVSFNDQWLSSVYVFALGSRQPEKWRARVPDPPELGEAGPGKIAGERAVPGLRRLAKALIPGRRR